MNTVEEMLQAFREFQIVVRGRAPGGVDSYIRHVRKYVEYLEGIGEEITSASQADIENWIKDLFYKHALANSSRATMLSGVRQFYVFLVRSGVLSGSPAAKVPSPKLAKLSAKKFTIEELQAIFSGPDETTELGLRDKAFLMLLYGAGPRVSEIGAVRLKDLSFTGKTVTVTFFGKGAKERTLKLLADPTAAIRTLYELRVVAGNAQDGARLQEGAEGFLFTSLTRDEARRGLPLSRAGLNEILKKYAGRVGIAKEDAFVHKMRSTFASDLYDITRDPLIVAAKMGHEDVKTTMRYIEISESALNSAVIPGARWKEIRRFDGWDK